MMIPLKLGALLFLLGTGTAVAQNEIGLDVVLDRMEAKGLEFRNLEAEIARTKVVVFVDVHSTDSGKVFFAGGSDDSRIRLTITEPAPQDLLISNGKAQLYRPRINQLEEFDLGERKNIAQFFVIGFGASNETLEEDYNVTLVGEEVLDGVRTSVLELEPKSERVAGMFPMIRLWIDQSRWIPVQTRLNETGGDYQIVKYSNIVINGRIPNDTFELDLPRDVNR